MADTKTPHLAGNPAGPDPLDVLEVLEKLEVGPAQLAARRLTVPYRATARDGKVDQTELIYRFEEDVFEPGEPESLNLASMIGAQLALNYGLFCKSIVFRGPFDEADRRLLSDMAENTSREIYVNKFLQPNPYLTGPAAQLPFVKLKRYTRASLEFPDPLPTPPLAAWTVDKSRHAILSSGGKDSLLTYGLLAEIGVDTHPIFGNESGRHWFTALNAYRNFREHVPNTGRVWMNSDRVFVWMLRRLPFIRPDFADVRSDIYPIRLWTVAVFLFGVLPLARRRGIGRLLIGDEYDTTVRTTHSGMVHYAGLYDQSRYFDNALTRYFQRKNWGVTQFSILRPLSELLIQKTLVERYPDLQALQVSCHSAHKEGERVKPCGRCEKCRRIVSMLVALGADAQRCGYTPDKIQNCLAELAGKGIHQEFAGFQHILWMLQEKGLVDKPSAGKGRARPNPEIASMRFDRERSPVDCIPVDLRAPLYRIYLQHAHGAMRQNGRVWVSFDPLSQASLAVPYMFEKHANPRSPAGDADEHRRLFLGELTWPEAQQRFKEVDVALLPVGAIEQHGPHLPLDTDSFDAAYLAHQVALRCGDPKPIVFPLIPYGVSYHHDDFAGTISVTNETLAKMVYEVGMAAARNGISKLVIINGHGGNDATLNFAAQMINRDAHILACVDSGETSDFDIYELVETPNDVHAGEIETSTTLAVRPELVQTDKLREMTPRFSSRYLNFTSKRGISWYAYTDRISANGVMGDPTKASAEKGRRIWEIMIGHLVTFVEDLKRLSLDEIHQRRY